VKCKANWILAIGTIILLILVGRTNADLSEGRYVTFMDEWISFDIVKSILHSTDFASLVNNILGWDQRYGRPLYYLSALFSWWPERIAGDQGQIIATRWLQFLFLYVAGFIWAWSCLTNRWIRVFAVLSFASLPHFTDFSSLPKPEPLCLFFLGLSWVSFKVKKPWPQFSAWLFLGLAFGMKISVLPIVGMVFIYKIYKEIRAFSLQRALPNFVLWMISFLLGWGLAVPSLFLGRWSEYLNWTFRMTRHQEDDSQKTILDWLRNDLENISGNGLPGILSLAVLAIGLWFLVPNEKTSRPKVLFLSLGFLLPILFSGMTSSE
jgi:hypothetical protein